MEGQSIGIITNMKNILCFYLVILSISAGASTFSIEKDGLCFKNGDPALKKFGPLGELGASKGVCQGMSGLVSAFHEHAKFSPTKAKMTLNETLGAISELRRYHSGGCKISRKVEITGYANLNEFCRAQKSVLLANAIDYNLDIAVREISWNLEQFLLINDNPVTSNHGRINLHLNVESLRRRLGLGRWPLMLYYGHVVGVHSVTNFYKKSTLDKVVFGIYDSYFSSSMEYVVHYSSDGLPKSGQKMIWDTTPSRLTTICW